MSAWCIAAAPPPLCGRGGLCSARAYCVIQYTRHSTQHRCCFNRLCRWDDGETIAQLFRVHACYVSNSIKDTNKRTKRQTDKRQKSNLVHFSLKMWQLVAIILVIFLIINWPNFVYLLLDPGFLFPVKFLWSIALRSSILWTPLTDITHKNGKRDCMN